MNAKDEIRQLHFEKALPLCKTPLQRARVLRALCRFDQAQVHLDQISDTTLPCLLEQIRLDYARGHLETAMHRAETAQQDLHTPYSPELAYILACLYAQQGHLDQAFQALEPIENDGTPLPLWVDVEVLKGDLYTFQEQFELALSAYQTALDLVPANIPENWQPLRKALILHNLADLYEQEEDWDQALHLYKKALETFDTLQDPDITDLSGARLELLLSYANCLANADHIQQAQAMLDQAWHQFETDPPLWPEVMAGRLHYHTGLFALYANQTAIPHLEQAVRIFSALPGKEEFLAKACYYLAWSLEDEDSRKLPLYEQACTIFQNLWQKEPVFYLDSLGQAANEKGRLLQDIPAYKTAAACYEKLLSLHPDEWFALHSLLVTLLNLASLEAGHETEIQSILVRLCAADPANKADYEALVQSQLMRH